MSKCYCLHPVIIKNHVEKYKINVRDWRVIIRGSECMFVPSPKKARIKSDELDSCYYYNIKSGEIVPCYIEVPCGQCVLCGDKKAKDWSTRMFCEANYHANCPWWITLTYNAFSLPKDGVNKRDVQLFLKRLRERVSRLVGSDVRLRFVATGEYGSNYARPHYHMQLFGLPRMCVTKVLLLLENAWSTRVSKERYDKLPTDFRFYRYDVNQKKIYYQRKGFVYVKPAHDNTPLYLAKYMFKPQLNAPFGKNPNFNLASRKNGIGYQYMLEFRDFHRRNPNVTQLSVCNKWTGTLKTFGIPSYFKDYWFPTISKLLPHDVKKSIDNIRVLFSQFHVVKNMLLSSDIQIHDDVDVLLSEISSKYNFLPPIETYSYYNFNNDLKFTYSDNYIEKLKVGYENKYIFGRVKRLPKYVEVYDGTWIDFLRDCYFQLYDCIIYEHDYVMSLKFDSDSFNDTIRLRDLYKMYLSEFMRFQPDVDPHVYADSLIREWKIRKNKDLN